MSSLPGLSKSIIRSILNRSEPMPIRASEGEQPVQPEPMMTASVEKYQTLIDDNNYLLEKCNRLTMYLSSVVFCAFLGWFFAYGFWPRN